MKTLPFGFPVRSVKVFGRVRPLKAPKFIYRVDNPRHSPLGDHGWQVRYKGTSKMFRDPKMRNGKMMPSRSLEQAVAHLASVFDGSELDSCRDVPVDSINATLIQRTGVCLVTKLVRSRVNYSIRVRSMGPEVEERYVYVGTHATFTEARFKRALKKAYELRDTFEQQRLDQSCPAR